jgi:hypothetical protein
MKPETTRTDESYRDSVERVFYEMGWDNLEDIGDWGGEDLETLRQMLPEEQFQALVDQLADTDVSDR